MALYEWHSNSPTTELEEYTENLEKMLFLACQLLDQIDFLGENKELIDWYESKKENM